MSADHQAPVEHQGERRVHLGDGVTVTYDGYYVVLCADATKTIYLDPGVLRRLQDYIQKLPE